MKKEKYIEERHSTRKGHENEITAFVVNIPYKENGNKKKYVKNFAIKDYVNANSAKKAAIKERDRMMPLLADKSNEPGKEENYTVDELFSMVPNYFPVKIGSLMKNEKVYEKHIKNIRDIDRIDVQKTLNHVASYCVQQTVRNVKTDWHRIFQVAQLLDINITDWTTLIISPKATKVTDRSVTYQNISQEEFLSFIEFMKSYGGYLETEVDRIYNRTILIYLLMVMRITGIRLQEARGLDRKDISFHKNYVEDPETGKTVIEEYATINICRSAGSTLTESNAIRTTKTRWSVRTLPVYGADVDLLKEALSYSKYDTLFATYQGVPFTSSEASDYIGRVVRRYRKVTGKDFDFYSTLMRKSYSSDQYDNNVSPATVKKLMGHRYASTSLDWYATASDASVEDAMRNRKYKEMG